MSLVPSSVEGILNSPDLCCIKDLRTRLALETILAEALDAYQSGDCRTFFKMLKLFMQKVSWRGMRCPLQAGRGQDSMSDGRGAPGQVGQIMVGLSEEEKACVEHVTAQIVDAGPHPPSPLRRLSCHGIS